MDTDAAPVSGTPQSSPSSPLALQLGFVLAAALWAFADTSSMSSFVSSTLTTLATLTAVALGSLYLFQDSLLYFPQVPDGAREQVMAPAALGMPGEDVVLPTPDGASLAAIFCPQADDAAAAAAHTILFFHGNAGNAGHRLPNAYHLHNLGFNVLLAEYRGYGRSTGRPSQAALEADAGLPLDWLLAQGHRIDTSRIIVFGRSLGGAVAIALAAQRQDDIAALVLENTFVSVVDMIDVVMPIFSPFKPLCSNPWRSADHMPSLTLPILFLSGLRDELVPADHMARLYDLAPLPARKRIVTFANGTHNETWLEPGYFDALAAFIRSDLPTIRAAMADSPEQSQ
ncbi:BEM46 family protein [Thecamonas trahens ATCC 50062]|uniref:BEM46 family protein n=1 Tax=Thecamonas trahens ATCC 50062 TaxID=461836 RepID=A0A0L0D4E8_THETB|nr:BEM46 family protein [Thecamonas trahens ATCC 50062]KNC47105.1 BEM46 family protein [Thecamonas trahens ATCC 50062]|eukprot:XP_013759882.1 BEM46 family protein [Thecamonas trahens ATCC 50062]